MLFIIYTYWQKKMNSKSDYQYYKNYILLNIWMIKIFGQCFVYLVDFALNVYRFICLNLYKETLKWNCNP